MTSYRDEDSTNGGHYCGTVDGLTDIISVTTVTGFEELREVEGMKLGWMPVADLRSAGKGSKFGGREKFKCSKPAPNLFRLILRSVLERTSSPLSNLSSAGHHGTVWRTPTNVPSHPIPG